MGAACLSVGNCNKKIVVGISFFGNFIFGVCNIQFCSFSFMNSIFSTKTSFNSTLSSNQPPSFDLSVDIYNDYLVIGDPSNNKAHIYKYVTQLYTIPQFNPPELTQLDSIPPPGGPPPPTNFGKSVSISSNKIVIGATCDSDFQDDAIIRSMDEKSVICHDCVQKILDEITDNRK